jgi:ribosomal-protein-alanine N-acetyltransferase
MTIGHATPADADALSRLHGASFEEGWSKDDFVTWLSRAEGFAVLASDEREPFAFGLALAAGDDAELLTIATSPAQRRRGWGKSIFHALNTEAKKRGLARWVLEVAHNNSSAIGLYKSLGFVEIGVRKAYYRQGKERADALMLSRPTGHISGQGSP